MDSIKISFTQHLSAQELKGWRQNSSQKKNGFVSNQYLYSIKIPNKSEIVCTYRNRSYTGHPLLTLEFSLPKLLFGNNVQEITDLTWAISSANEIIAGLPGVPEVDISSGELLRLDIAYNHQVGNEVTSYLHHLSGLRQARRKTIYYPHETVYFRNKTVTTKYYDKHKQSDLDDAKGMLRQEISFTNKQRIRQLFEVENLGDLNIVHIMQQLQNDLASLHLNRPIPHNGEYSWKALVEEYGQYGGIFHYGLLGLAKIYPIAEIAEDTGRHHRSIDRQVQKALATTNGNAVPSDGYLPALSIDVDIVSDKQIVFRDTVHA